MTMSEEIKPEGEALTEEEFLEKLAEWDEADLAPVEVEEVEEVAEVVEPEPVPTPKKSKPEPKPAPSTSSVPPTTYAVVGGKKTDDVMLSRAIYKNIKQRRSLTVHHIQRRLVEWGFKEAHIDQDGFYGDRTKKSVALFQESLGLEATGLMNAETMTRLFEGDTNVTLHLS